MTPLTPGEEATLRGLIAQRRPDGVGVSVVGAERLIATLDAERALTLRVARAVRDACAHLANNTTAREVGAIDRIDIEAIARDVRRGVLVDARRVSEQALDQAVRARWGLPKRREGAL